MKIHFPTDSPFTRRSARVKFDGLLTKPDNRPSRAEFVCTSCKFACHADVNAALVAHKRAALAILSGDWKPNERRKVKFRSAGTVQTDGAKSVYAQDTPSVTTVYRPMRKRGATAKSPLERENPFSGG